MVSVDAAEAKPPVKPECSDRLDNDGDGLVDHAPKGGDPDCTSRKDSTEGPTFACTDAEGDGTFETPPAIPNGTAQCDLVTGDVLGIRACDMDYHDLNGVVGDGCEYGPVRYTGPEQCDGVDNDADGYIDEGLPECGAEP